MSKEMAVSVSRADVEIEFVLSDRRTWSGRTLFNHEEKREGFAKSPLLGPQSAFSTFHREESQALAWPGHSAVPVGVAESLSTTAGWRAGGLDKCR